MLGRWAARATTSGRPTPAGGRTASPQGADPEYEEQILPLAAAAPRRAPTGCSTSAAARGRSPGSRRAGGAAVAVGVDPTAAQVVEARAARAGARPTAGPAPAALPFPSGAFDAVVACLVFEHIRDVDAAIAEVARVLAPGGRFLFFLNHPLLQTPNSGWIDDQVLDPPEQYWRIGPYLVEDETIEEVEKGVFIPFIHRPLSRYVNALADAGLTRPPHGGARPSTRVPRPCGRVRGGGHHPAPPLPPLREAATA